MKDRILFVDDEPGMLALYSMLLKQEFEISVATGGEQGLAVIEQDGPFAVIVSDFGMPGMNGAQFLARARVVSPDSVRMLLTGHTNIHAAIEAVNEGNIFRFLNKPCPRPALSAALRAGIEQYRLITAEKILLEKTLRGSIEVLTEILSLINPQAFGKASRIRRLVQQLGKVLEVKNPWILEVAAMLSQIGCIAVPDEILTKVYSGTGLTKDERSLYDCHPRIGSDLICKIPRLEEAAQIVFFQNRHCDDRFATETPGEFPLGSLILKVALDCEELESRGSSRARALEELKQRHGWYSPDVLKALEQLPEDEAKFASRVLPVSDLRCQMILAEDLLNKTGVVLVRKGQEISAAMLTRLNNHAVNGTVRESVRVWIPAKLLEFLPIDSEPLLNSTGT